MIGRESQLAALAALLDEAASGHPRLVSVTGDIGSGKTTVVEAAADLAEAQGFLTLWGRAWQGEGAPAYWPWIQILRVASARAGSQHLKDELTRMERVLGGGEDPDSLAFALHDEVALLISSLAVERPLALILEDLHATDRKSVDLLRFTAGTAADVPLLLIATAIEDGVKSDAEADFRAVLRAGERISLRNLDEAEVGEAFRVFAGYSPPPTLLRTLHRATEGNPLFVREAVHMLASDEELTRPDHSTGFRVPAGVRNLYLQRFEQLPQDLRAALEVAAVMGPEFDAALLSGVVGSEREEMLDLLQQAVQRRILKEKSALGIYRFAHVLIRETLYESVPPARRLNLHSEIAAALHDYSGHGRDEQLAHHLFKSARKHPQEAFDQLLVSAQKHHAIADKEAAHRELERARSVLEMLNTREAARRLEKIAAAIEDLPEAGLNTPQGGAENELMREGDYWTLRFAGRTSRLKDAKGLRYLRRLLDAPGRELHVLDLVRGSDHAPGSAVGGEDLAELGSDALGDAGDVLDAQARAQYRRRLLDLQEDLEEARSFNDPVRADRIQEEIEALIGQLAGAVGIGGRSRKAASNSERARISVTKALRSTLKRIELDHPQLGQHLNATLRTGTYCVYSPDPRSPIEWRTSSVP